VGVPPGHSPVVARIDKIGAHLKGLDDVTPPGQSGHNAQRDCRLTTAALCAGNADRRDIAN
jgi:hypothetical protein